MESVLNRDLMRQILEFLAKAYPATIFNMEELPQHEDLPRSLHYLAELGLIKTTETSHMGSAYPKILSVRITAKGLDFLADDGGYSAIIGAVTVRLHADTIKSLLVARIERSDLAEQDKNRLLGKLNRLGYSAVEHLLKKSVDVALESSPTLIQWLQSALLA